jgi:hypothetical protein
MPIAPEPQQPDRDRDRDRDRDDRTPVRRAAAWLRDNPDQAGVLGIANATDARALAVVLDILAVEVPHLDADLRQQTVESCRSMLADRCRPAPPPSRSHRP